MLSEIIATSMRMSSRRNEGREMISATHNFLEEAPQKRSVGLGVSMLCMSVLPLEVSAS
jgi:hypothetical protein